MKNQKDAKMDSTIDMDLDDSIDMDVDIDFDSDDPSLDNIDLSSEDITGSAEGAEPVEEADSTKEEEEKPKKKRGKKKKGEEAEAEEEVIPDRTLVILMDRSIPNFLTYCRNLGLNVHSIFHSVKDMEDFLLFRSQVRIVIMETGVGKFNNINNRQDVVSLIGSCDEDRAVTVFFTDSVLRMDAKQLGRQLYKSVQWHKFDSTLVSIATLLEYKENFILGDDYQQETFSETNLLHSRGKRTKLDDTRKAVPKLITPEFLRMNVIDAYDDKESKYKPLEEFVPKY